MSNHHETCVSSSRLEPVYPGCLIYSPPAISICSSHNFAPGHQHQRMWEQRSQSQFLTPFNFSIHTQPFNRVPHSPFLSLFSIHNSLRISSILHLSILSISILTYYILGLFIITYYYYGYSSLLIYCYHYYYRYWIRNNSCFFS